MKHFSSRVQERENSHSSLQQHYEYNSSVFIINFLCTYNWSSGTTEIHGVAYGDVQSKKGRFLSAFIYQRLGHLPFPRASEILCERAESSRWEDENDKDGWRTVLSEGMNLK